MTVRILMKRTSLWSLSLLLATARTAWSVETNNFESVVMATKATTVDALVAEALARNPELKFYQTEIAAAKAGRKTAGLLANPEVSGSVGQKTASGSGLS